MMIRTAALAGLALGLSTSVAAAQQMPSMDMSWGIQQQMMLQRQGDAAAAQAAQNYYNYMLWLRAHGYTGPSLPTGVTPQSLAESNRRLQEAYDAYNRGAAQNSERNSRAIEGYSMQVLRGCSRYVDQYGRWGYVCP